MSGCKNVDYISSRSSTWSEWCESSSLIARDQPPHADLQAQKNGRAKFGMFLKENSLISCFARFSSSSDGHQYKEVR